MAAPRTPLQGRIETAQRLDAAGDAADAPPPGQVVLLPVPGSEIFEPAPQQPPTQQPPEQSPDPSPPEPEQQPDPGPDGRIGTDAPHLPEQDPEAGPQESRRSPDPSVIETLRAGSIALPRPGVPTGTVPDPLPTTVAQLAARVAAYAPGAATTAAVAAGAAGAILLTPRNFQGGTIELGDGLRAQWKPGQRSATIERRTSKGLFGSSIGENWERLPVDATYEAGPDGRATLFVDPQALKAALAAPHFLALPASKPSIFEIRIGASADGGATTSFREATHEDIERLCPGYPMIRGVGARASMEYSGLPNGLVRGNAVHSLAKIENLKIARSEEMLREMGIRELLPEIALRSGERFSYRAKGSSVLDVAEIYGRGGEKKACVYDFKTGNATFPDATAIRYAYEVGRYANEQFGGGYMQIIVAPIYVH
jgi:hypothetical protein